MLSDESKAPRGGTLLARTSPAVAAAVLAATLLAGGFIGSSWPQRTGDGEAAMMLQRPAYPGQAAACDAPAAPATAATCPDAQPLQEPESTQATLAAALEGQGTVLPEHFDALLSSSSPIGGAVTKNGMLPTDLWMHTSEQDAPSVPEFCRMAMCDPRMADAAYDWVWDQVRGEGGGIVSRMPLGVVPPKAALCTMLFNPAYKVAFVRSTKVGGTSLMGAIGSNCQRGISWDKLQESSFCFVENKEMQEFGLEKLGYESWEALWADYTVFTLVRNPYDRAGSSYDYILGRHENTSGHCAAPEFEQFCARPYILGVQDMLFGCGDAIHDFYHTEPQAPCLMDSNGDMNVDYVVRLEHLAEDYAGLVELINARRAPNLPELKDKIGWKQKGPLVKQGERVANRHLGKYEECGAACFDLVRNYFAGDFKLLGYPTTEVPAADESAPVALDEELMDVPEADP